MAFARRRRAGDREATLRAAPKLMIHRQQVFAAETGDEVFLGDGDLTPITLLRERIHHGYEHPIDRDGERHLTELRQEAVRRATVEREERP